MKRIPFFLVIGLFLINPGEGPAQQTGNKAEQTQTKENTATPSGPVVHDVSILHVFLPQVLTIYVGDSVRWTNNHGIEHNVKSEAKTGEGVSVFVSGQLMPNNTYITQFNKPGVYEYVCAVHPAMNGIIIVKPRP